MEEILTTKIPIAESKNWRQRDSTSLELVRILTGKTIYHFQEFLAEKKEHYTVHPSCLEEAANLGNTLNPFSKLFVRRSKMALLAAITSEKLVPAIS